MLQFLYNLYKGSTNVTTESSNDLKLSPSVSILKTSGEPFTPVVVHSSGKESNILFFFSFATYAIAAIIIIYYSIKVTLSYLGSKAFSVVIISYPSDRPLRVGETITTKITFSKLEENGQETVCTPGQIQTISSNINIRINKEDLIRETSFLKTIGNNGDHWLRFSLRVSGDYKLSVKCGYFHFIGSPFSLKVLPGPMSPLKTFLNTPNPKTICVIVGQPHYVELIPQDKYGNLCPNDEISCKEFSLKVKIGDMPIDEVEFEQDVFCKGDKMFLGLKTTRCNIYIGHLTFAGHPVKHGSLMFVSMSVDEDGSFKSGMKSFFTSCPGPCRGMLTSVGSESTQPPLEVWINVTHRQIAISNLILGFIYYPFKAFCVNRRTWITYNGLYRVDVNENDNLITLQISDGIQDNIIIALTASDARILLASYSHFQGQKLTNYSFEDKKSVLKSELGGILAMLRRLPKILHIDGREMLASSIKSAPTEGTDWMKPFKISYANPSTTGPSSNDSSIETAKWLEMLIEMLFDHNETGLFSKHKSSLLLHPTLGNKRKPRWEKEYFEFAGSVLGKCVYDSMIYGECLKLTRIRFTRSFLAQLIGVPITYKHFLTDDPSFYNQHVQPVLHNEEDVITNLRFTDIRDEGSRSPGVNLIPNGEHIPVTKRNKEKYLNMIAIQRLKTPFTIEINAFRTGFYKIIPQGLIADFDEDELEKLFCGGGRSFDLSDLKLNSRIVGDLTDNQGISSTSIPTPSSKFPESQKQKVLHWFWTSVANMSDEEHERLLRMTTGSLVLPSCGFKDLNPKFTIALTGNHEEPPTGHPSLHQISLGNHSSYEKFEKNLLTAIHGPSDSDLDKENNYDLYPNKVNSITDTEDFIQDNSTSAQTSQRLFNIEAETETETIYESDDEYPCVPWIRELYRRHCAIM